MSPVAEINKELENIIRELTLRMVVPRMSEFDWVWEATNRICDGYDLPKAA